MAKGWHSLLLAGSLLMAGCQHGATAEAGVRVMSADGQVRQQVVAAEAVSQVKALWNNKREVVLKQRPVFAYRVELGATAQEQWLYSDGGYAVLASQPYGTIYWLGDAATANRLLGIAP